MSLITDWRIKMTVEKLVETLYGVNPNIEVRVPGERCVPEEATEISLEFHNGEEYVLIC